MLSYALRPMNRTLRDNSGVASIEAAFALPVVITFLIGTFELGGIMLTEMLMEGAIREASRMGMTGTTSSGLTREEIILQKIDDITLNLVDIDEAVITQLVYDNFSDIGKPEPLTNDVNDNGLYDEGDEYVDINGNAQWDADMGAIGLGGGGDVVVYTVSYSYPSMTGILSPLFGEDGTIKLSASTAILNEPF